MSHHHPLSEVAPHADNLMLPHSKIQNPPAEKNLPQGVSCKICKRDARPQLLFFSSLLVSKHMREVVNLQQAGAVGDLVPHNLLDGLNILI